MKRLYIAAMILFSSCQKELSECLQPTFRNDPTIYRACKNGLDNGGAWIVPTSGTPPFKYSIDGGKTYVDGPDEIFGFDDLKPGTYQLRMKSAKGCESDI